MKTNHRQMPSPMSSHAATGTPSEVNKSSVQCTTERGKNWPFFLHSWHPNKRAWTQPLMRLPHVEKSFCTKLFTSPHVVLPYTLTLLARNASLPTAVLLRKREVPVPPTLGLYIQITIRWNKSSITLPEGKKGGRKGNKRGAKKKIKKLVWH